MKKTILICCTFLILNSQFSILNCNAQTDTLNIISKGTLSSKSLKVQKEKVQIKKHDPKTASCLAIIPGAGQIYNKKYWKLPIVYAGLGATSFLIYYYADLTSLYRREYVARMNNETGKQFSKLKDVSIENVLELRNFYRRNMEICIGACAIVYVLSILDACVDAHLFYYDVSEDLSLGIKPKINYNPINGVAAPGVGLIVKF
jgi:hypothetical protein